MGIRFACSACKKPLNIKHSLAGKRSKCPQCGLRFRIPWRDQPFAEPLNDESSSSGEAVAGAVSTQASSATAAGKESVGKSPSKVSTPAVSSTPRIDPLTENPTANWYVRPPTGGQYGPAAPDIMRQWLRENRVGANAMVWCEGWATWREAQDVFPQLAELANSSSNPAVETTSGGITPAGDVELTPAGDAVRAVNERRISTTQRRTLTVIALAGISLLLVALLFFMVL